MSLFINDTNFGKVFTKIHNNLTLKGYGGNAKVHPDLIPFPNRPNEVLMVYTPEEPADFEDMCLVHSNLNDMVNWSDDLWNNPVIKMDANIPWKRGHLADFCLLYVPELANKWWTWFQPSGSMGCVIAVGTSQDGITWTDNYPQNPVMYEPRATDSDFWYDRAPSVLWNRKTQKFEMIYDNLRPDWGAPSRLMRAESIDGFTWTNRQIIYNPADYGLTENAFHPVWRYFDGYYWCWFPMDSGVYFMKSQTGLAGSWSIPIKVISNDRHEDGKILAPYRVGVMIDDTYKMHMMVSHYNTPISNFEIDYYVSDLSTSGKTQLQTLNYTVSDYDMGGSIIGKLLPKTLDIIERDKTEKILIVNDVESQFNFILDGRTCYIPLVDVGDVNASNFEIYINGEFKRFKLAE